MLQFIIGAIVGASISFFVFCACRIAGISDRTDTQFSKKTGEENAEE